MTRTGRRFARGLVPVVGVAVGGTMSALSVRKVTKLPLGRPRTRSSAWPATSATATVTASSRDASPPRFHRMSLRHRRRPVLLALVALAVLLLAACGSDSSSGGTTTTVTPPSGATLEGSWNLVSYTGPSGCVTAPGDATMAFAADGTFSGNTGCNVLNGTYTTSGDDLTVTPGPMTLRACVDPAAQAQGRAGHRPTRIVTTFTVDADQLTLSDADGGALFVFTAGTTGLEGTSWTVTGVNDGTATTALVGAPDGAGLTLEFGTDGTVGGSDGCNSFSGPYTTDGDTISVSPEARQHPDRVRARRQRAGPAVRHRTPVRRHVRDLGLDAHAARDADGAMQVTATSA